MQIHQSPRKDQRIWINGRFLTRKITGVERVAHEILRALATHFLSPTGQWQSSDGTQLKFAWALPPDFEGDLPDYGQQWHSERVGTLQGHAWEQWSLARFAPQDWLLNLCNTAPLLRRKQAIFFHDAQVFALPQNFDWKFRLWYKCLLQVAGRRAKTLLTNSNFSAQELEKFTGISIERFHVCHLGVDHMARLAPQALNADATPYVLAVSSASPNKNFVGVVQSLALLHQDPSLSGSTPIPTLKIAGQTYSKVFQATGLSGDAYTKLGYVSDEALAGLYQHAVCLVYPSYYEGFGLPPLEAMRMGCPVVVSRTSAMPEVCGDAAIYCDPSDSKSIAQAVAQVLALSREARMAQQQACIAHASSFTWHKTAERLLTHLST